MTRELVRIIPAAFSIYQSDVIGVQKPAREPHCLIDRIQPMRTVTTQNVTLSHQGL